MPLMFVAIDTDERSPHFYFLYLSSTRQISPELDFPCTRPWACISVAPLGLASTSRPYPLLSRTRNSRSCTPSLVVGWKEGKNDSRGRICHFFLSPFFPIVCQSKRWRVDPSFPRRKTVWNREDDDASSGMRLDALTHWLACQKLLLRVTHRLPSLADPLVPDAGHLPLGLHARISCRSPRKTPLFLYSVFRTESDLTSLASMSASALVGWVIFRPRITRCLFKESERNTLSLSLSLFTRIFSRLHRDPISFPALLILLFLQFRDPWIFMTVYRWRLQLFYAQIQKNLQHNSLFFIFVEIFHSKARCSLSNFWFSLGKIVILE